MRPARIGRQGLLIKSSAIEDWERWLWMLNRRRLVHIQIITVGVRLKSCTGVRWLGRPSSEPAREVETTNR